MPYENLGIIKVPERIARFSACIAVCIYSLYVQEWVKNRLLYSTELFTSGSEGEFNVITTNVRGERSHT